MAWCLAVLAGAVDLDGLVLLKHHYVSFMSGNITSLGRALAGGVWPQSRLLAELVLAFVGGAAAGEVLAILSGHRHLGVLILAAAALLVWPACGMAHAPQVMALSMGLLNSALRRAGGVSVNITYVTGALARLGQGMGAAVCGRWEGWGWAIQAVPWTGLLAGAIGSAMCLARWGHWAFALPPAYAATLGVATLLFLPTGPA